MKKKYTAKSEVSLNIALPSGKNKHIAFMGITGGGSAYYTADSEEQAALERHPRFGRLFRLSGCMEEPETPSEKVMIEEVEADSVMKFSCAEDAKNYLCETYGVSRTKLKTLQSIIDCAAGFGLMLDIND